MKFYLSAFFICATLFFAAGCDRAEGPGKDVVAIVNGEPISLRMLEAVQDFGSVGLGVSRQDSVDSLKKQYGEALAALIVRTLVMQELKKASLEPSETQLEQLESTVRKDYDDDEFERELTEDNISLDVWRKLMRLHLAVEIFADNFLKNRVYVPLDEMEAFYEAHKTQFKVPRTLTLKYVSGDEQALVASARSDYLKHSKSVLDDRLVVVDVNMRGESVPQEWRKEVLALSPGQATAVKSYAGHYHFVSVTGIRPERQLSLLEAYPLVESILLEGKLDREFGEWLRKAVALSSIKMSTHLLPTFKQDKP